MINSNFFKKHIKTCFVVDKEYTEAIKLIDDSIIIIPKTVVSFSQKTNYIKNLLFNAEDIQTSTYSKIILKYFDIIDVERWGYVLSLKKKDKWYTNQNFFYLHNNLGYKDGIINIFIKISNDTFEENLKQLESSSYQNSNDFPILDIIFNIKKHLKDDEDYMIINDISELSML